MCSTPDFKALAVLTPANRISLGTEIASRAMQTDSMFHSRCIEPAAGIEPASYFTKLCYADWSYGNCQDPADRDWLDLARIDSDLLAVIQRWPSLPVASKRAVTKLMEGCAEEP